MTSNENVLGDNIGRIELLDWMGGDLANVNGARASYSTRKEQLDDKDIRLLRRLGDDIHHTPLRHTYFHFAIEAPEFVARQWYKHIVGCEFSFKDLPWSEFSQRYKEVEPKFYIPQQIRAQDLQNKQASIDPDEDGLGIEDEEYAADVFMDSIHSAYECYKNLLAVGVAREQARIVLPLATYTSWVWTASIQAVVHFCTLRDEPGAQFEIQAYAKALREMVQPLAPHTWDALEKNHPVNLRSK